MRKDLNMRKGKMIAQGAHASMKVLLDRGAATGDGFMFTVTPAMAAWLGGRFTKGCGSVDSQAALDEIHRRATEAGLPGALIVDAGPTQFKGVPTKTRVAVGPAGAAHVDPITRRLP